MVGSDSSVNRIVCPTFGFHRTNWSNGDGDGAHGSDDGWEEASGSGNPTLPLSYPVADRQR